MKQHFANLTRELHGRNTNKSSIIYWEPQEKSSVGIEDLCPIFGISPINIVNLNRETGERVLAREQGRHSLKETGSTETPGSELKTKTESSTSRPMNNEACKNPKPGKRRGLNPKLVRPPGRDEVTCTSDRGVADLEQERASFLYEMERNRGVADL